MKLSGAQKLALRKLQRCEERREACHLHHSTAVGLERRGLADLSTGQYGLTYATLTPRGREVATEVRP